MVSHYEADIRLERSYVGLPEQDRVGKDNYRRASIKNRRKMIYRIASTLQADGELK